jgi:hypothetical protein
VTTLTETQRLLWQLITAPEGVAAALAADGARGGSLRAHLVRTVRGDRGLEAVQRLDIYANMYFFRILDVLKEDYRRRARRRRRRLPQSDHRLPRAASAAPLDSK